MHKIIYLENTRNGDNMAYRHSSISFALVNIPITINPIIKNNDIAFNQLHKKCLNRVKYLKYCPVCKKNLKETDIIKGYEIDKNNYLTFTKTELDNLKPSFDGEIEVVSFIKEDSIPIWYYDKTYYLSSSSKTTAYGLFCEALKKTKRVALVKTVISNRFYFGIVKFVNSGLVLSTIYFNEEINLPDSDKTYKNNAKELDLAIKLIESMAGEFTPSKYKDEYQNKLREAINNKAKGKSITSKKRQNKNKVLDLMNALEKSLKEVS